MTPKTDISEEKSSVVKHNTDKSEEKNSAVKPNIDISEKKSSTMPPGDNTSTTKNSQSSHDDDIRGGKHSNMTDSIDTSEDNSLVMTPEGAISGEENSTVTPKDDISEEEVDNTMKTLAELKISETEGERPRDGDGKVKPPRGTEDSIPLEDSEKAENLSESLLDSDGDSYDSDLDSDGLDDNYQTRRPRCVGQNEAAEGGPDRVRLATNRHQPYNTTRRSPLMESSGSRAPNVELSQQHNEFIESLISGQPTNCSSEVAESELDFQNEDVEDILRALENNDFLVGDSYQTSIPTVVEEKVNEVEQKPNKKNKRAPRKSRTATSLRTTNQTSLNDSNHPCGLMRTSTMPYSNGTQMFVQNDESQGLRSGQINNQTLLYSQNASASSAQAIAGNTQTTATQGLYFSEYPMPTSGQATIQPNLCLPNHLSFGQQTIPSNRALVSQNPYVPQFDGSMGVSSQQVVASAVTTQANLILNDHTVTNPSLSVPTGRLEVRPFLPQVRITTAGTLGVPSQQFLPFPFQPVQQDRPSLILTIPQSTSNVPTRLAPLLPKPT